MRKKLGSHTSNVNVSSVRWLQPVCRGAVSAGWLAALASRILWRRWRVPQRSGGVIGGEPGVGHENTSVLVGDLCVRRRRVHASGGCIGRSAARPDIFQRGPGAVRARRRPAVGRVGLLGTTAFARANAEMVRWFERHLRGATK